MTARDCFLWEDTNEDPPQLAGEYVGMWIDSDGTTSTLPVHYDPDSFTPWTHDDQPCAQPHAWCANPDAHQANPPTTPPDAGDPPAVNPPHRTPRWVRPAAAFLTTIALVVAGAMFVGAPLAVALAQDPPWDMIMVGGQLAVLCVVTGVIRAVDRRNRG